MKILLVNWSWYPSGGDWTYISNIQRLYEEHGHEIVAFSTKNVRNVETEGPAYFVESPDYKALAKRKNISTGYKAAKNSIVSRPALRMVDEILANHKIDVAHLHNIHHYITPAIIKRLRKAGVKIIWSLHDYKIICPDSLFLSNGVVCEKCLGGHFIQCTLNKCKKNSRAASFLASIEAYYYHRSGVYKMVDAYLCPSSFLRSKFLQAGFNEKKLHVTNLCYDIPVIDRFIAEQGNKQRLGDYVLYIGRLENFKGIRTMIEAMKDTGIPLKIAGTGTNEKELRDWVAKEKISNIEFLGFQDRQSVFSLTLNSRFSICGSECYENFPFSVIESSLFSKPSIGSRIGGIPELVVDGETGLLFEPGNAWELRERITELWQDNAAVLEFGARARKHVEGLVNFNTHWEKVNAIINNITN